MPSIPSPSDDLLPSTSLNQPSGAIPTKTLTPSTNPSSTLPPIRIGTRRSKLARIQTDIIVSALQKAWPERAYEVVAMDPLGDRDKNTPLHAMGAKSLWTAELEVLLEKGGLDVIVHSCKDMPTQLPLNLSLGCTPPRANPFDALVLSPASISAGHTSLHTLPAGSVIGTSSLRRVAQLKRSYPNLAFADCRGNVPTRLAKLDAEDGQYAALILAAAGLERLDLGARISKALNWKDDGVMYAVSQGAIGVEVREGDEEVAKLLEKVDCEWTHRMCLAERSLMRTLEGGCSVPIGVETEWLKKEDGASGNGEMLMRGIVVSLDGKESVTGELTKVIKSRDDVDSFGREMAKVLVEKGADKILQEINLDRGVLAQGGVA
ncbi:putative porphobilinogen deaminase Hem3 [Rhizodiscina lignyota]|uniref:Porphobilinogen deaminase n=1 Tax=Rhizodiscina lignyota TaxID=1504668 RepID=A0A9P4ITI5_9PEZI|nr:putative porphobilinogen deaminase Hem3 [Rhizodiscina lignyota]